MAANSCTLRVMCSDCQSLQFLFGLQHHYILCNGQIEQEVVERLRQVSLPQCLNGHHVLAFRCGNCGQRPMNTTNSLIRNTNILDMILNFVLFIYIFH
jgi:ribosomal protein S27E